MKKTYQQPATVILGMMTTDMIASSLMEKDDSLFQDLSQADETDATSGNLSRRRTVWDDGDSGFEEEF